MVFGARATPSPEDDADFAGHHSRSTVVASSAAGGDGRLHAVRDRSHDLDETDAADLSRARRVAQALVAAKESAGRNSVRLKAVQLRTSNEPSADVRTTRPGGRGGVSVAAVCDAVGGKGPEHKAAVRSSVAAGDGLDDGSSRSSSSAAADVDDSDNSDHLALNQQGCQLVSPSSAASTVLPPAERPVMLYASGDPELKAAVFHAVRALGMYKVATANVRENPNKSGTGNRRSTAPIVFVLGCKPRRSVRLLLSMAEGAWVVHEAWLLDSICARSWKPFDEYVPLAFPGVFAARKAWKEGAPLLNGLRVGFRGVLDVEPEEFIQLVQAAGGCYNNRGAQVMVAGGGNVADHSAARGEGFYVVNQRWLPDSIAHWEVLACVDYAELV